MQDARLRVRLGSPVIRRAGVLHDLLTADRGVRITVLTKLRRV